MKRSVGMVFSLLFALILTVQAQEKTLGPQDFQSYRDKLEAFISDGVAVLEGREYGWLTGVFNTDAKLILIPSALAGKPGAPGAWKTTVYLMPKSPRAGIWDDPRLSFGDDVAAATGIPASAPISEFLSDVAKLGAITDTIYVPYRGLPGQEDEAEASGLKLQKTVARLLPGIKVKNLTPVLGQVRWSKNAAEVGIMRRSCAITAEAFKEAARFAAPGQYEYSLKAVVDYVFQINEARSDFIIIGSGPNSCVLHHQDNDRKMVAGDLVVIDIGNEYRTMSTDLTRTIPLSGVYTEEQKKIYGIVLDAQKKAIAIVRPGVTLADVHRAAFEVIDKAGYGKYFIHGTSHTLNGGSQMAYVPARAQGLFNAPKDLDYYFSFNNPVLEGTMFTIEPGIYIPQKNLGVRIEDSILVTENGCEVLTRGAPKEISEVEKLMKEKGAFVRDLK